MSFTRSTGFHCHREEIITSKRRKLTDEKTESGTEEEGSEKSDQESASIEEDQRDPRSSTFRVTQLEPRGITSVDVKETEDPHEHFGTTPCTPSFYRTLKLDIDEDSICSRVFLDLDDRSLRAFAKELDAAPYENKAWYQNHYLKCFLKADPRYLDSQEVQGVSRRVVQQIQSSIQPEIGVRPFWTKPPIVKHAKRALAAHGAKDLPLDSWNWDLRPDVQYWLNTSNFPLFIGEKKRNCRSLLREVISVPSGSRTSPYTTWEFQTPSCDVADKRKAVNRVMAAGAMSIYNRAQARVTRLMKQDLQWTARDSEVIKHYAVVVIGREIGFYCITLKPQAYHPINSTDWKWTGCEMRRLNGYEIDMSLDDELRPLKRVQKWINEIHRWGFCEHFMEIRKDVCLMMDMRAKEEREWTVEGTGEEAGSADGYGLSDGDDTFEASIDLADDQFESIRTRNVA